MSNLIDHARYELETIKEDPEFVDSYLKIVETFANMGHSGGSAEVAICVITQLLNQTNLSPLTDNPEEWEFHPNEKYGLSEDAWGNGRGGVWQNKRNSEAFSGDAGKTHYLISETTDMSNPTTVYVSRNYKDI